jgi:hypothetical protein
MIEDRRKTLTVIAIIIYIYGLSISLYGIKYRYMDGGYLNLYALILLMWLAYETSWKFSSKWLSRITKLISFLIIAFLGLVSGGSLLISMLEKNINWDTTNYNFLCIFLLCILFVINLNLSRKTKT